MVIVLVDVPLDCPGIKLNEEDFTNTLAAAVLMYQIQQQEGRGFENQKTFYFGSPDQSSLVLTVDGKKYTVNASSEEGVEVRESSLIMM
jgi:hypothetical protein